MRRTYRLERPAQVTKMASFSFWKQIRKDVIQLMMLGPVEIDLTAATHISRAQLAVLLKGIHKDAAIADEHLEIILTVKHPNPEIVAIAMFEYKDGIWEFPEQG